MIGSRKKALINVQAFLPNDKEIVKIIDRSNLNELDNWRLWGNGKSPSIKICKNKFVKCYERNTIAPESLDLYFGAAPKQIAKISKSVLIIIVSNIMTILFLGKDNKFRLASYHDDKNIWVRNYPLSLQLNDIRTFIKYENVETYLPVALSTQNAIGWVTIWPPKPELLLEIEKDTKTWNYPAKLLIEDFLNT